MLDGIVYQNGMVSRLPPSVLERSMSRASRLLISVTLALVASAGLAFAKDSVTIGMVLEPPGLDPTSAPAAAIGRGYALQYFRGPDEDQRGLLGHASAGRNVDLLARPQDADLQAAGRTSSFRTASRSRRKTSSSPSSASARKNSTNKDKAFFASIELIETPDRQHGRASIQGAKLRGAVSPRHGHRRDHRREERGGRGDEPGRHWTL